MTIKEQIIERMKQGYAVCEGSVNELTNSQSGGRRLREIMEENGSKYYFFWVEPKFKGRNPFKVFFKKGKGDKLRIDQTGEGWKARNYIDSNRMVETKGYKNTTQAKKAIKKAR